MTPWRYRTNAPLRARKVPRPFTVSGEHGVKHNGHDRDLRTRFVLYYLVPTFVFGAIAAGVLVWHMIFGTGAVGLLVFFASSLLAMGFGIMAVLDWLRFWRRQ